MDYVALKKRWQGQDRKTLKRINKLLTDIKRSPFEGIGKPEPMLFNKEQENLSGFWSRRIDDTNRLVYVVDGSGDNGFITVVSCRYHY